jgi:putative MATE family efflux protein
MEPLEVEAEVQEAAPTLLDRGLPLWQVVFLLAAPVWAQQFLHLAVSLSDAWLAGRIVPLEERTSGQSAQTTASYLQWFISSFSVLVSAGSTALVARFVGARDRTRAIHVTHQSLVLGFLFGLSAGVPAWWWADSLVALLGLEGEVAVLGAAYLRPLFLALPLQMIEVVGIACLVGAGDTVTGMWVLSLVALLNVPLAWALCQGWGPLPALGFVGISTGTALAHGLGCLLVVLVLTRGRAGLRLDLVQFRPDWPMMRRVLRISIPAGIDSLSVAIGQLWFLSIVNRLDTAATAAHGIALRWEGLGYLSGGAFGVAAMSLIGQSLGARRPDQAERSVWTAFGLACGVMCAMGLVFFVLAGPMFRLFCPHPEQQPIVEAGVPVLRLVAGAMPALASCIVFSQALRGAGDTRLPVLITWIGFFAVRIPLAYWLTVELEYGLFGAWLAMFADLHVRGIAFFWRFRSGRWKTVVV